MRSISSSMINSVRIARLSTEVKATSGPSFSVSSSRPSCAASLRPCADRSTSVQPVNRFSTFQVLWPWRTRISLPGTSVRQLAHGLDAHGEGREVAGARGAHVRERALPMRETLAGGLDPGGPPGLGAAAVLARQHPLGETALHAQRRIPQTGSRDGLPRTLDLELFDARPQPVEADARADLEVHARSLGDAHVMAVGDLHDVQCSVERFETRNARGERRRQARVQVVLAPFLEVRKLP